MAKNQFISTENFAKVRYSEIPIHETSHSQAHWALMYLLKNSYVKMNAYNEIEVQKLIKCLKILKLKVTIKQNYYPKNSIQADNEVGIYEFMLDNFLDDRIDGCLPPSNQRKN
ncbi:hypothetical protein WD019_03090 [Fictibacillus sp. Mic-4]|uniref:hypothetical protein n=1 Tax=Fictibacillus sp. Mic-4 TaxID=3132826 RepID=UPI003CF50FD4